MDRPAATASVDPVAQPSAYQAMLLALLGADDPAVVQGATPAAARRIVDDAGRMLRMKPAPEEWSVLEVIGHVLDGELMASGRYRWILSHDRPPLMPYDQDRFAEHLRHNDAEPEELIRPLEALIAANIGLWHRVPVAERARYGIHQERGPESYDLTFRLDAGHHRFHLAQARDTLVTLRSAPQETR